MTWPLANFSTTLVCCGVLSFVIYRTNAPISQQRAAPLIGSSIAILGGLIALGQLLSVPHYLYVIPDFDRLASQQFFYGKRFIEIATLLTLAMSITFIGWRVARVGAQAGSIHIVFR